MTLSLVFGKGDELPEVSGGLFSETSSDMEQNVKGRGSAGGLPLGLEQRMALGSDGGSD